MNKLCGLAIALILLGIGLTGTGVYLKISDPQGDPQETLPRTSAQKAFLPLVVIGPIFIIISIVLFSCGSCYTHPRDKILVPTHKS